MALDEFSLIKRYFSQEPHIPHGVVVGVGDDAAVIRVPEQRELVITTDTLIEGIHFSSATLAEDIAFKSLAVSLSDLASMGAIPRWFTLALTLPEVREEWLASFSAALLQLADEEGIALIGGDTTRGALTVTIQAMGLVHVGSAVLRSGARAGDDIYVTGTLGDAALGLKLAKGQVAELALSERDRAHCLARLNRPTPRTTAGYSLAPFVDAMIDCSDGFAADLGHILEASECGAEVELSRLPLSAAVRDWVESNGWDLPLSGGDDYELIFTASPEQRDAINGIAENLQMAVTPVGVVSSQPGLRLITADGEQLALTQTGYQHF